MVSACDMFREGQLQGVGRPSGIVRKQRTAVCCRESSILVIQHFLLQRACYVAGGGSVMTNFQSTEIGLHPTMILIID